MGRSVGNWFNLSIGICASTLKPVPYPVCFTPSVILVITYNKASVKIGGTWHVYIWQPFEDKYEYNWKGKTRC